MKTIATIKSLAATVALAASMAAPAALAATPATALAASPYEVPWAETAPNAHYEGEKVTVGDDWGQPVYAEWHRGDSGRWWATFWTYNYSKVYAAKAPAGCGWVFYTYDRYGNFVQVIRCEESAQYGIYGPEGVSSHWQGLYDGQWY